MVGFAAVDGRIDRRTFVARSGLAGGALVLGGVPVDALGGRRRRGIPIAKTGSFPEGVASGEPVTNGATLWTRLGGGYQRDRKLFLEVSPDADFRRTIYRRNVIARAERDHTIGVRVRGARLQPGERYYYRFETRERESPVGRFKTALPADSREPVRIAFFSCQDYQAGYFGALKAIADIDDLDLAVFLGDYIYERTYYEGPEDRKDTTGANKDGEVQTLAEYRDKYRFYRGDADLRALHAAHPFMAIWDDHEVEDNYAGGEPGEATLQVRVPFEERRESAYRAFFEYMPFFRAPAPSHLLYRNVRLGRHVELFLTDQRRYRDKQPCGDQLFVPCPDGESAPRDYLGPQQLGWLKTGLERSDASWKLVGNQLMVMSLDSAAGQPINKDSWDGYGVERRDLLGHLESEGVKDVSFLTGDIHTFFAGDVGVNGRGPGSVATEFVGGSITSLGIPETFQGQTGGALTREQIVLATGNIQAVNPHIKYDEQLSRGYGIAEAREDELLVDFLAVEAATKRSTEPRRIGRFRVARGEPRVQVL